MSLAPSGRIKFLVTGARGATFADVARQSGSFGAGPQDSDLEVSQKFADYAIQKNPNFKGNKGDPGGSVMSVGLFSDINDINIPVGTDYIQTSGFSQRGIGAARYSVDDVGSSVAETRTETNTGNGRAVRLAETSVTIDMLGAIPDCNTSNGEGTPCSEAIQYGIDWLAARGGAELWVPGVGAYKLESALKPKNKVTLRGTAQGLQGGGGVLFVTAPQFLSLNDGGYPSFNLVGLAVQAGTRGVTDFITRQNGVWSYSTIQNNYFVNFRYFSHVGLGLHVFNNNFQNFYQFRIGGADHEFSFNYANHDVQSSPVLSKNEVFWIMEATGATSFSFNYLTCLKNATDDPIVFEWSLSNIVQCICNKFDGGTICSVRIRSASNQIVFTGNRATSLAKWSTEGYVGFLLNEDISDVTIADNFQQNIEAGAPFISMNGVMNRVTVRDNMINKDRNDTTMHDAVQTQLATGSTVNMSGGSVPKSASLGNGGRFFSHYFNRLWTNASPDGGNPRINYVDMAAVQPGIRIKCYRANTAERWIIYDQGTSTSIYDSDRDNSRRGFELVSMEAGKLVLDI